MSDDQNEDLSWMEVIKVGRLAAAISFLALVSLGVALRAYSALRFPEEVAQPEGAWWLWLFEFGVGGAVMVGTVAVAWRLANRKRSAPRWGMAVVFLSIVLFGLLVWPTPWTFREYGCKVFQINRVLGRPTEVTTLPSCETKDTVAPGDKT